jgi:hypothetical protein
MTRSVLWHHQVRPANWPAPSRSRIQHAIRVMDMRPGRVGDLVPVDRMRSFRHTYRSPLTPFAR